MLPRRQGAGMNILFPAAGLTFTDHLSLGEGLIAFHLARALIARGHAVTVLAPQVRLRRQYDKLTAVELGNYPVHPLPDELRYDWFEWRFARRAAAYARRHAFDIVHHAMPFDVTRGYSLLEPLPQVIGPLFAPWEISDGEYGERRQPAGNSLGQRLRWHLVRRYARYAEKLNARTLAGAGAILLTQDRVRALLPEGARARVQVVPIGIAADRYTPAPVAVGEPEILFLAYLVKRKGLGYLLAAMPRVWEQVPRARLTIVGDGPDAGDFRAQAAALPHQGRIVFAGAVAHDDTPDCFRRAAVYALPSLGEPFGLAVLEAMSCALPVAGFAMGSLPGLVSADNRQLLTAARDSAALADTLVRVLRDGELRRRAGQANRARVLAEFTWERVAARVEAIYGELLARRASVGC